MVNGKLIEWQGVSRLGFHLQGKSKDKEIESRQVSFW